MKSLIALALAASLLSPRGAAGSQSPDSLTVRQAVQRVLATHPAVQAARNGLSASAAEVEASRSALRPTVAAMGTYSRVGPVPSLTFGTEKFELFPANNYDASATARYTLYDFGRRGAAVEEARTVEASASDNVEAVRSRLAYQTIDAFYGVLFMQENLKVQDEEIRALTEHLQIAQERVRAGAATDFDVLSTQVRIARAKSQRVDVANGLEQRTIELRELLGLPRDSSIHPVGDFETTSPRLEVDSLIALALEQRPDVKVSRDAEASATVRTRLASLADRPSVSLDLSVGAKNGYVPNLNRLKADFVAGVAVQVPVYTGGRTGSEVQRSEAEAAAARSRTRALERTVSADVERAVATVRASQEKIQTADVQVRQASAALDLARTRYQAGVVTNLDVLDSETLLAQAKLLELQARYDLVRSGYRLDQAVGNRPW